MYCRPPVLFGILEQFPPPTLSTPPLFPYSEQIEARDEVSDDVPLSIMAEWLFGARFNLQITLKLATAWPSSALRLLELRLNILRRPSQPACGENGCLHEELPLALLLLVLPRKGNDDEENGRRGFLGIGSGLRQDAEGKEERGKVRAEC